jgi:ABC-2 type transport system permease protein
MFKEIFLFELRQGFKKPATYIFFGIFFILSLFIGLSEAGVFDTATADSNLINNSALSVANLLVGLNDNIMGLVNGVILVAIMATAIQKDYEYNTHALFFTKPISKAAYFFGRFTGAFIIGLFVFSAQVIGYYFGCLAGAGTSLMGPFSLMNYLLPFLIFSVPNLLLLGAIFFSVTTFTRSTLPAYLFCIILLVIRTITSSITADLDNKTMAAVLEPFGSEALSLLTQYWTPDDQNTRAVPLHDSLLYNRILWFSIAVLITLASYFRFQFSQFLTPVRWFGRKSEDAPGATAPVQSLSQLPRVSQVFSQAQTWKQLFYLAGFEFKKMTKSAFFIIICALGVVMMFIMSQYMGAVYDTETYPVTYAILQSVSGIFQFFILIVIVFFSGTIVWREREQKIDELIGATPVNDTVLFFSKYLALVYVIAVLLAVSIVAGILIQFSMSFYDVQPLLYIGSSLKSLVSFMIVAGLCMAVQVITPNKYLGFFLSLVPLLFMNVVFRLLEWNNNLYIFNSSGPAMPYSDMNGFGHTMNSWLLYKGYWLSIILVLSLISLRVYARGKEKGLKARFRLSNSTFKGSHKLAVAAFALIAIGIGSYIYYNVKVLNNFSTPKEEEALTVDFERTYRKYVNTPQLRIVSSNTKVDIYPAERSVHVTGFYYLKNKHNFPVDTLFINYAGGEKTYYHYAKLEPSAAATLLINDLKSGVKLFKLTRAVQPGDSIRFDFDMAYKPVGFKNDGTETSVVYNGTFFNNMVFPAIGYNPESELSSNAARKKYGLPSKPRMADIHDSLARMNTYISNDADWIRFETEVSTSGDQIAIAPGYLQKEWKENGRNHYHYKMDSPILNFYAFLSAAYQVKRDKWNGVNIEIYYQKGHEYNLDRMIKSIKKSLDYYTKNFSPYQHRQVRILEFPRYASFAQSFPNTIPFSESVGFIAKVDDKNNEKIDVPFYITAHEVAHQWWAHQVIGGNVQGCVVMSETMSQYSALMVMEKEYGKQAMKKFLKYEMDHYLQGRASESKKEVPLMLCENQDYIHYNKGSVIMYSLQDYLGEDVLNAALRKYIQKTAFQEPPYTNAIEFVDYLRAATPDSLKYIIKDMFETITIYENYVKDLSYTTTADGKYKVKLTVGSAKFRADSVGKQQKIPVADYMDIGIFAQQTTKGRVREKELVLQKIKMDQPEKTFEFIVNEKPLSAGLDPYNKLIDRTPDNNTWKFGSKPPKVSTDAKESKGPGGITISVGD